MTDFQDDFTVGMFDEISGDRAGCALVIAFYAVRGIIPTTSSVAAFVAADERYDRWFVWAAARSIGEVTL